MYMVENFFSLIFLKLRQMREHPRFQIKTAKKWLKKCPLVAKKLLFMKNRRHTLWRHVTSHDLNFFLTESSCKNTHPFFSFFQFDEIWPLKWFFEVWQNPLYDFKGRHFGPFWRCTKSYKKVIAVIFCALDYGNDPRI